MPAAARSPSTSTTTMRPTPPSARVLTCASPPTASVRSRRGPPARRGSRRVDRTPAGPVGRLRAANRLDFCRATIDASPVHAKRGRRHPRVSPGDRGGPGSKHRRRRHPAGGVTSTGHTACKSVESTRRHPRRPPPARPLHAPPAVTRLPEGLLTSWLPNGLRSSPPRADMSAFAAAPVQSASATRRCVTHTSTSAAGSSLLRLPHPPETRRPPLRGTRNRSRGRRSPAKGHAPTGPSAPFKPMPTT